MGTKTLVSGTIKLDPDLDWRNAVPDFDLARCRGGYDDQPPDAVYSAAWNVQPKLDGLRKSIQLGKTCTWTVSRNREDKLKGVDAAGKFVAKKNWGWLSELLGLNEAGTILDGELHIPGKGVADAMHAWSEVHHELQYVVFDCLFRHGQDLRGQPYRIRLGHAKAAVGVLKHERVVLIKSEIATPAAEKAYVDRGEEGVIFASMDGVYGDRKSRWKKKAQNPVDLVVMGVSEKRSGGSGVRGVKAQYTGKPAAAEIGLWKDGRLTSVGWMMNLADADKALTLQQFEKKYLGKVARAICSGWEGVRFRWVRFVDWHEDKTSKQCVFSEQIGGKVLDAAETV